MQRNSLVLFYALVSLALALCVAGILRYDRNREKQIILPPQPPAAFAVTPFTPDYEPSFFDDYLEAATAARQQRKPILLLFTAKNCVYSQQMLDTTFRADEIKPFLQRFVLVNIDINSQKEISRWLGIDSTPTIQFLSSEGVPLQRINGAARPEDLIAQMNTTLQTIAAHSRVIVR